MPAKYDTIGRNYSDLRRPDPRIANLIVDALGSSRTVLNVGAGAGSYEPSDRLVTALEPSREMIRKRQPGSAPVVQGLAGALPFRDGAFDAAMAVLTIHHWPDKAAGLREMRRTTRGRIVLLTHDPSARPWLTEYLPELAALDEAHMPTMSDYQRWLGPLTVSTVPIPHDCVDGFLYSYWRRPEAYLDQIIRSGSSSFWSLGDRAEKGLRKLQHDLDSGVWKRKNAQLIDSPTYDAGYRLVVAESE